MALTDDDVREILRLIDESELDELRIETAEFKLHVVRGEAGAPERKAAEPAPAAAAPSAKPTSDGASATIAALPSWKQTRSLRLTSSQRPTSSWRSPRRSVSSVRRCSGSNARVSRARHRTQAAITLV